jgi:hypothetical protein
MARALGEKPFLEGVGDSDRGRRHVPLGWVAALAAGSTTAAITTAIAAFAAILGAAAGVVAGRVSWFGGTRVRERGMLGMTPISSPWRPSSKYSCCFPWSYTTPSLKNQKKSFLSFSVSSEGQYIHVTKLVILSWDRMMKTKQVRSGSTVTTYCI